MIPKKTHATFVEVGGTDVYRLAFQNPKNLKALFEHVEILSSIE